MDLLKAARDVRERAWAPYSRFKVGAAIRAESGAVYVGCNVENVAYPEGTCAEAGAIAAMIAGGDTRDRRDHRDRRQPRTRCPAAAAAARRSPNLPAPDVRVTMATIDGKIAHGDAWPNCCRASSPPPIWTAT